ncbi:uncharacterized protein LOC135484631 [Lineus longissimus]|uniref:uncharacterized protein LOC135484631 n=1 Tax=Lineus longissimus TaxID=88925 RepID=UPI00315C834B
MPKFWPAKDAVYGRWTGYNYALSSEGKDFLSARSHCRNHSSPEIKVDMLGDASEPLVNRVLSEIRGNRVEHNRVWRQLGGLSTGSNMTKCAVYDFTIGQTAFASCKERFHYVCFKKKELDQKTNPKSYWYLLLQDSSAVGATVSVRLLGMSALLSASFRWIGF